MELLYHRGQPGPNPWPVIGIPNPVPGDKSATTISLIPIFSTPVDFSLSLFAAELGWFCSFNKFGKRCLVEPQ